MKFSSKTLENLANNKLANMLTVNRPNIVSQAQGAVNRDVVGGPFRSYYSQLVQNGVVATTLLKTGNIFVEAGPLRLGGCNNLADFLLSAKIAVQGNALKIIPTSQVVTVGSATVLTLTNTTFFGALIRYSISPTNANYQRFPLQITYGPGLATTLNFVVTPMKNVVDIITLFPSNNAGLGLVQGVSNAVITIPANAAQAGAVLSAETLNQRDL